MLRSGLALGLSLLLFACTPPPQPAVCNASTNTTCGDNQICALDKTCVAPSYADNQNGTVTDHATGLIWEQNVPVGGFTWSDDADAGTAQGFCASLTLGGAHDWRLPRLPELNSLTDLGHSPTEVDPTFFPGTPTGGFWSESATDWVFLDYTEAWVEVAADGSNEADTFDQRNHVRCVRDQTDGGDSGCTCADAASCTDSCGNTGSNAAACFGMQCGANAGVDTCGQPDTSCQPDCTCANLETCTDACGHVGQTATQCIGLVCDSARDGRDSCGVTDVECGP